MTDTQIELPELPYAMDALEPHLSRESMFYHYAKHHAGYVYKLNEAIAGTWLQGRTIKDIIMHANGEVYDLAAQVYNHSFYWQCLSPDGGHEDKNKFMRIIERDFSNIEDFKAEFTRAATGLFASGWVWLVMNPDGSLQITTTHNADTPLKYGQTPLLICDVWEHAYYIDYRDMREDYLAAFWQLVDWEFVNSQYTAALQQWPIETKLDMVVNA